MQNQHKNLINDISLARFLSMIIVTLIVPKLMIVLSVMVCLVATLLISFEGGETANYLFAGAALYGFAISWHYGSGVSWTAEHMDVVVRKGEFLS